MSRWGAIRCGSQRRTELRGPGAARSSQGIRSVPYRIEYSKDAAAHLDALTAGQRALVLNAIGAQLRHQPRVETRNRKLMRPNIFAQWELRVRNLRVYYNVHEETEPVVVIEGIGVKIRDRVWLGGKEADFQ